MIDFTTFFKSFQWKTALLILIVALTSIALSTLASIALQRISNLHIPSIGNIKTLGVEAYWDINLENKTESMDWGTISPRTSKNVTLYIRSISNLKTMLFLNATNWNPANISNYLSLSWNYNGTIIRPGEIIQVTLTPSASSHFTFIRYLIINDVKQFSIDIFINTSEIKS